MIPQIQLLEGRTQVSLQLVSVVDDCITDIQGDKKSSNLESYSVLDADQLRLLS